MLQEHGRGSLASGALADLAAVDEERVDTQAVGEIEWPLIVAARSFTLTLTTLAFPAAAAHPSGLEWNSSKPQS